MNPKQARNKIYRDFLRLTENNLSIAQYIKNPNVRGSTPYVWVIIDYVTLFLTARKMLTATFKSYISTNCTV